MTRIGTEVRLTQFSLQESKSETWQFQVENNQLMEIAHTQEVIVALASRMCEAARCSMDAPNILTTSSKMSKRRDACCPLSPFHFPMNHGHSISASFGLKFYFSGLNEAKDSKIQELSRKTGPFGTLNIIP